MTIQGNGIGVGAFNALNVLSSRDVANAATPIGVSQTISSAIDKVDGVAARLDDLVKQLDHIADVIGGPRGVSSVPSKDTKATGVVGRLHDAADRAHDKLRDAETIIASLQLLLG